MYYVNIILTDCTSPLITHGICHSTMDSINDQRKFGILAGHVVHYKTMVMGKQHQLSYSMLGLRSEL